MSLISAAKDFATSAGGGSVIGAGLGLLGGQLSATSSAKQAKEQMDFQERMSNTAYQRAATDLEKAGLNRVLALGSPATTPGGAMGQVPDFGSAMASGSQAGVATASGAQSIAKQQAEINQIVEQTVGISAENQKKLVESEFWKTIGPTVQKAAGNVTVFLEYVTDPANLPAIQKAATKLTESLAKDAKKVISSQFGNIPEKVQQFLFNANQFDPIKIGADKATELKNYFKGNYNNGK